MIGLEIYGIIFMLICIFSTISRKEFKLIDRIVGSAFFVPVLVYLSILLVGRF